MKAKLQATHFTQQRLSTRSRYSDAYSCPSCSVSTGGKCLSSGRSRCVTRRGGSWEIVEETTQLEGEATFLKIFGVYQKNRHGLPGRSRTVRTIICALTFAVLATARIASQLKLHGHRRATMLHPRGCSLSNRVYGFLKIKKKTCFLFVCFFIFRTFSFFFLFFGFFRIFFFFLFIVFFYFSDFLLFFGFFFIFRIFSNFFLDFFGFFSNFFLFFLDFPDFFEFFFVFLDFSDFFEFFFCFFWIFPIFSNFFFLGKRIFINK